MQGLQVTNTWFRASVLTAGTQALPPQGLLGKLETGILRGSISEYWECRWCQNSSKGRLFHFKACTWKQCGWDFLSDSEPTGGSQVTFPGLVHPWVCPKLGPEFVHFSFHSLVLLSADCALGAGLGIP